MLLMLIGPLAGVIALSFTDYQLGAPSFAWIGLANYQEMFADRVFWISLKNTLIYVAVVVPGVGGARARRCAADRGRQALRGFYRAVYFLPVMATLIAMAIVWEFMLHPQFGLVNGLLQAVGLQGHTTGCTTATLALFTLCGIGIWQSLGFNMVLFMAGLTSIPHDLYEAAAVDGAASAWSSASGWSPGRCWGRSRCSSSSSRAIRSFQVFDTVQVLTKGGPNKASEVLLYTMYAEGLRVLPLPAMRAAVTVVFLAFVLALSLIKIFVLDRRECTTHETTLRSAPIAWSSSGISC